MNFLNNFDGTEFSFGNHRAMQNTFDIVLKKYISCELSHYPIAVLFNAEYTNHQDAPALIEDPHYQSWFAESVVYSQGQFIHTQEIYAEYCI